MEIIDRDPITQHSIRLRLGENAEVIKPDYKNGQFRPERMIIRWANEGEGWRLNEVSVRGPMLKKDGSLSDAMSGERKFAGWGGKLRDDTPDWVRQIIDAHPAPKLVSE